MDSAIVLHSDDVTLIDELSGTTEVESPNGLIRFLPPVKNQDHNTDSLLCVMSAIMSLAKGDVSGELTFAKFESEFGFMEFQQHSDYGY